MRRVKQNRLLNLSGWDTTRKSVDVTLRRIHFPSLRFKSLFLFLLFFSFAQAQEPTRAEKVAWLLGASATIVLYDYLIYYPNQWQQNSPAYVRYQISKLIVQAGLSYLLYEVVGLPTAIAFNLTMWTFGHDMAYYGLCEIDKPGTFREVTNNKVKWAGWTPIGLMQKKGTIAGNTLIAQSAVGFSLAITICLW